MKQRYGYVRVSSRDQNIDRQMAAMAAAGINKEKIYIDKLSGKDFNRPSYQKLSKKLKAGDEVYIKSIDRLGRNYDEIIEQWRYLTRVKEAKDKGIRFGRPRTELPKNFDKVVTQWKAKVESPMRVLDRVLHHAHVIQITGISYRLKNYYQEEDSVHN